MKKLISIIVVLTILCSALSINIAAAAEQPVYIDNSDVTPKYVDDEYVKLEDSGDGLMSPDWVKDLIIAQVRIQNATEEGTFESAIPVLDHYQETGVSAIWLNPIFDDNDTSNYGNFSIHTINKELTGKDNYEEGWAVFKSFVDEAHKRNIRVILDIVTWGVDWEASLYNEKPDWFAGESHWGGWTYNWNNEEFKNFFVNQLVWLTTDMGVDGFRCDLEPGITGYTMFKEVREKALAKGEKIVIFSESTNERFNGCYDFDEHSTAANDWWAIYELFTERYDIVDTIKTGMGISTEYYQLTDEAGYARFYTYLMSCHDAADGYGMKGSMASTAYQALFSPFIPIFFMGEEFNNDYIVDTGLYSNPLNLDLLNKDKNREFFEEFKKMIRIRRLYGDIFTDFTKLRDTKMERVEVVGIETIQGYVRYNDKYAVIVVANNNIHTDPPFIVRTPFKEIGYEDGEYQITDLMTGKVIATGNHETLYDFKADVPNDKAGIYLLSKVESGAAVNVNAKGASLSKVAQVFEQSAAAAPQASSAVKDVIISESDNNNSVSNGVITISILAVAVVLGFVTAIMIKKIKSIN